MFLNRQIVKETIKQTTNTTMKTTIKATAPTIYQIQSLRAFGATKANLDGSYTFEQTFKTKGEARSYLLERAMLFAQGESDLREYKKQINKGYLELDAVTANIN